MENRIHFLVKGVLESVDKKRKIEYIRLVRNYASLHLDRTQNKEEIFIKTSHYITVEFHVNNAIEENPNLVYVDSTWKWDMLLVELGLPCVGVCFSREKKIELGIL